MAGTIDDSAVLADRAAMHERAMDEHRREAALQVRIQRARDLFSKLAEGSATLEETQDVLATVLLVLQVGQEA